MFIPQLLFGRCLEHNSCCFRVESVRFVFDRRLMGFLNDRHVSLRFNVDIRLIKRFYLNSTRLLSVITLVDRQSRRIAAIMRIAVRISVALWRVVGVY